MNLFILILNYILNTWGIRVNRLSILSNAHEQNASSPGFHGSWGWTPIHSSAQRFQKDRGPSTSVTHSRAACRLTALPPSDPLGGLSMVSRAAAEMQLRCAQVTEIPSPWWPVPKPSPPAGKEQVTQRWPVPRAWWTPANWAKVFCVLPDLLIDVKPYLTTGSQLSLGSHHQDRCLLFLLTFWLAGVCVCVCV